ncbi:SCO6880 family protein [Nonomuraea typhae]|uniref:SCO6880 family protein n=1 Tax=Nonomuraea typhae TaxID=2603600 RepID=UPI0012F80AFE|nr:SCO6880 family protein [Nonomuraea typhae]
MAPADSDRTYGNWRKPTSPGIGQLGLVGTLLLLGGLVACVITMMFSLLAALILAACIACALLPMLLRDRNGRTGLQTVTTWLSWLRGRRAGQHLYRSGPLGLSYAGQFQLPGLAAASTMVNATDSYGRDFGLIVVPATGHYTAVFEASADGAALVDADQVDTWVAYWGQWLAALAYEPALVAASVVIETAPDLGTRLEREVHGNLSPDAPELAAAVLSDVVRTYPAGSAQVSTRIAVTYAAAPRGGRRRSTEAMAREVGTRLPGLTAGLSMTGAGAVRPMTSSELAEAIRIAYDPACHQMLESARSAGHPIGLAWEQVGPAAAQESWDHYRHDSGISVTWGMSEAPRGEVLSGVLTELLAPHRDITRKRVALLYRPYDPASAARLVERDRRDARFRLGGAHAAARDSVAVAAADQSAREEAKGAGLVRFAMLVTATVPTLEDLPAAAAAIDVLAPPARIRLRRMYGAQAPAFAAALPLGLVLPDHLQVPQTIREAM